jgi:hypothetical protein
MTIPTSRSSFQCHFYLFLTLCRISIHIPFHLQQPVFAQSVLGTLQTALSVAKKIRGGGE